MSCRINVQTQVKDFSLFQLVAEGKGFKKVSEFVYKRGNIDFSLVKRGEMVSIDVRDDYQREVNAVLQEYTVQKVITEARQRGMAVKINDKDKDGNVSVEVVI